MPTALNSRATEMLILTQLKRLIKTEMVEQLKKQNLLETWFVSDMSYLFKSVMVVTILTKCCLF